MKECFSPYRIIYCNCSYHRSFIKADHIGHMTLYKDGRTICLTCSEGEE